MVEQRKKSVVVVGGGLGGMSAAISLAAEGFQVELLEKNAHLGGKLNLSERDGFSFDLGPSIFTLPQIFEDLFDRAGRSMDDYLKLERVAPQWRNVFEDGLSIDLYEEGDLMRAELDKLPGDADRHWEELQGFLEYARDQYQRVESGYFAEGLDTLWEFLRHYGLFGLGGKMDWNNSMSQSIEKRLSNDHLRRIFEYFIKYVGSSARDAPGYMNLMPIIQFDYGLWYVKGGMYELARALERLLGELGVTVHCNTEVTTLEKSGKRVTGVVLGDGEVRRPDYVVSNMEVIPAYRKLLGEPPAFLRKLRKFAPACSGLVVHLGTDRVYPRLAHHNFFYSRDQTRHFDTVFQKGELPDDPTIYLVAPTRTNPALAPEGCDNLKILPHIPPIDPEHPLSEQDYLDFRERVLIKLERMGLENLRQHVIVEETLTPPDIERLYGSNRGAIYGVVSDWKKNMAFKAPKQSSRYENLLFTGGSANPGGGMPMVVLCGQKVCDRIVAKEQKLARRHAPRVA